MTPSRPDRSDQRRMVELAPDSAVDVLTQLHSRLDAHFRALRESRDRVPGQPAIYALEHGLSDVELDSLRSSVRVAVLLGFGARYWRQAWLPFMVYAAESGYDYEGTEYWPSFEEQTPRWAVYGDRDRVRAWFRRFADEYGGAVPRGAFARNFTIISWPITHAVLPVYLQRYLAQLLYDFRMGLTSELLQNPEELGVHLEPRAWGYTDRFRIFCSNTSLLGHVAAALLSGEGEDSPYLLRATLQRLVEGLEQEADAKRWLHGARSAASRIRARGFQPSGTGRGAGGGDRLPNPTSPRLELRLTGTGWRAFAKLPNLTGLSLRLPHVFEELSTRRAFVEGADNTVMARGRLVAAGQEVCLDRWPSPDVPFLRIEDGDSHTNALLRDQVEIARGPFWLFKRRASGVAVEVVSRVVHPGGTYYVVHDDSWTPPDVSWSERVRLDVRGATAVKLVLPHRLAEVDSDALVRAGLNVTTNVRIRPVGLPASSWDGEGAVEWLLGESGLLGINAEQAPVACVLAVDGQRYTIEWPGEEREMFVSLDDLPVGQHELAVTLVGSDQLPTAQGALSVTIRDPQTRSDAAEPGEGIRLLASPARPSMSELWGPGGVTVQGPDGLRVDLDVSLRSDKQRVLDTIRRQVTLPLLDTDWVGVAEKIRGDARFARHFDQAESLELTVRSSVGYASLRADRGFQPLRWQVIRERETSRARLIDRTDSGATTVTLYRVETPLAGERLPADADVTAPSTGGLLVATAGEAVDASASVLLPVQPNALLGAKRTAPEILTGSATPAELMRLAKAYRLWAAADLPGDVFAQRERDTVLESITRGLVSLVAGSRWAHVERRLLRATDPFDLLEEMQAAVGTSDEHKRLAAHISRTFYAWLNPPDLLRGFAEAVQGTMRSCGLDGYHSAPRLLLTLAGRPGEILTWEAGERGVILHKVLLSPVLLRAARFAVLGTRLLSESHEAGKGF